MGKRRRNAMLTTINRKLETWLYAKGFVKREVRQMVRNQLYFTAISVVAVSVGTLFSLWSLGFAAGAVLITLNFLAMARVAPQLMHLAKGAVAPLLFQFYGRLLLTGLCLFVLIAWLKVPVTSLLAGVTVLVINVTAWGVYYAKGQKVKEA